MTLEELKKIRTILSAATGLEDEDQEIIGAALKAIDALIKPRTTPPAAQRQWVGLTDEDVYLLANEHLHYQTEGYEVSGVYNFARALDKKAENARELGLDYEPVAWSDTKQSELNDWFLSLPTERQAVLLEDKWMLAGAAFLAGKTTPPAQPAHLAQVVRAHIQDLRACLPTLREHKLSDTAAEVEKAANELEAAAAQPAPVQPIGYEKYVAIREGHRNASEETYFAARPDLPLTTAMLKLFRDGFDRGYDIHEHAIETAKKGQL